MRSVLLAVLVLPLAAPALADDGDDAPRLMPAEWCMGAPRFRDTLAKFDGLKAHKRDRVGPVLDFVIVLEPGEAPPQGFEFRDGDTVRALDSLRSGDTVRSENIVPFVESASPDAKACVVDPAREGRAVESRGYSNTVGFGVRFLDASGEHALDDLEDGLKDGRSHWKRMVGMMGFAMPKFDWVAVASDASDTPPRLFALKDGNVLGELEGEFLDNARMVSMDALEAMGADALRVEGSDYRLTPSPSPKTVRRFMGGGDEADD